RRITAPLPLGWSLCSGPTPILPACARIGTGERGGAFRWRGRRGRGLITASPRPSAEDFVMRPAVLLLSLCALVCCLPDLRVADKDVPEGFEKLFNGKDLSGWKVNEGGKLDKWGA